MVRITTMLSHSPHPIIEPSNTRCYQGWRERKRAKHGWWTWSCRFVLCSSLGTIGNRALSGTDFWVGEYILIWIEDIHQLSTLFKPLSIPDFPMLSLLTDYSLQLRKVTCHPYLFDGAVSSYFSQSCTPLFRGLWVMFLLSTGAWPTIHYRRAYHPEFGQNDYFG